jgi:hypothetical protein
MKKLKRYGDLGVPGKIPPNIVLHWEVELVTFSPLPPPPPPPEDPKDKKARLAKERAAAAGKK